jgi:hypothetical protein
MNITEIFNQLYNTGILAFAIILLAIAIMTYPTLQKHSRKRK